MKSEDVPVLATLFFTAFRGTVHDPGQTETQYASKVMAILGGRYREWIPEASWTIDKRAGFDPHALFAITHPTVTRLLLPLLQLLRESGWVAAGR
jgi:hypothetical protein